MKIKVILGLWLVLVSVNASAGGKVLLDGKKIKNISDMGKILEEKLALPANSGNNLDVIYESLITDVKSESIFRIKHLEILKRKIGVDHIEGLIEMVGLASDDNARVVLVLE